MSKTSTEIQTEIPKKNKKTINNAFISAGIFFSSYRFIAVCDKWRKKSCEVNKSRAKDKSFQVVHLLNTQHSTLRYTTFQTWDRICAEQRCNYDKVHREMRNSVYVRDKHC